MILTESDIKYIVESVINELAQNNVVDNFQWVENYIKSKNPSDDYGDLFWFVRIEQRKKDNENLDQCKRYIKTYEIFSSEQLKYLEKEIKFYCERYNARAYIALNPRSLKTVDFYTDRDFKLKRHDGYERAFNSGRQLDIPERPIAHIDVDSEDINLHNEVIKYLQDNGIDILHQYRTPNNGLHIVIPDKELVRAKKLDFHKFGSDVTGNVNNQMFDRVDMLVDRPIILYANTQSRGYDSLNQSYSNMIAKHPRLGQKHN